MGIEARAHAARAKEPFATLVTTIYTRGDRCVFEKAHMRANALLRQIHLRSEWDENNLKAKKKKKKVNIRCFGG